MVDNQSAIPRGIEVLVKKASVDGAFREALMTERAEAAKRIGLQLTEAEKAMLRAIPAEQLAAIIDRTRVEPEKQPIFRGTSAVLMLLAIGALTTATCLPTLGHTIEMSEIQPPAATQPADNEAAGDQDQLGNETPDEVSND
jgi:hypothetical protein